MKITKYPTLLLLVLFTHSIHAATLRLDFSGQTFFQPSSDTDPVFTGTYEGYFLIDSTVESVEFPFLAFYVNSLLDGSVTINGNQYNLLDGGFNRSGVSNNAGEDFDSFSVSADMIDQDGEVGRFALQLVDMSNAIFDSTAFPSTLSLSDFDPFDHGSLTGSFALLFMSSNNEVMNVEYAELRPVPLPGALLLFGSALLMIFRNRE